MSQWLINKEGGRVLFPSDGQKTDVYPPPMGFLLEAPPPAFTFCNDYKRATFFLVLLKNVHLMFGNASPVQMISP